MVRVSIRYAARRDPRAHTGRLRTGTAGQFKIVVEKHSDGYVAYPVGMKGTAVGEGDAYEEALADVKSAMRFHIEAFGDAPGACCRSTLSRQLTSLI